MTLPRYEVDQSLPKPTHPRPIVSIGAGGIVRDAHLPAYRGAGFEVHTVYDPRVEVALSLAADFDIPYVASCLADVVSKAPDGAVFDLAVPAQAILHVLPELPDGAGVLIQKPMGETLAEAEAIAALCHRKQLVAAVNFQLRYAPFVRATKRLISLNIIGEVIDVDVKVNVHMPWERWEFLERAPRMEPVYHSIHYFDLVRDLMGEPDRVLGMAHSHPAVPKLESTRSATLFDFGKDRRATVVTYHGHTYGLRHQESYIKIEGTQGVTKTQMGVNLDYPRGGGDYLEFSRGEGWCEVPLDGSWFPDAFAGTMTDLMIALETGAKPLTNVDDALKTMQVVEAIYANTGKATANA